MSEIQWSLGQTDPNAQARAYNYAEQISRSAGMKQAGQKFAAGDYKGAADGVASQGDIQGAMQIQGVQQKQQQQTQASAEAAHEYIGRALPVFQKVAEAHAGDPDGGAGALGQAFDQMAPEIAQVTGHPPQALAQFRQSLVSDPKGTIARVAAMLPVKYSNVAPGGVVTRQQGDQITAAYTAPPKDDAPRGFTWADPNKSALAPIPGGPGDPKYKSVLAEQNRAIIVNNPIPQQGGAGAGGKTIDERMINTLLHGDPNSPEYAAAYNYQSKPKVTIDQQTGQPITITQDLSWARPPAGRNGPRPNVNLGSQVAPAHLTDEQSKAAGFANRIDDANSVISQNQAAGTDFNQRSKAGIPLVGNYLVSPEYQKLDQAERNFVNAVLRRESGAAISESEFQNARKQYLPTPGDGPAVLKQKAEARQRARQSMGISSGPKLPSGTSDNGGWSVTRVK